MENIKTISVPNILFDKYFKLLNTNAIKAILGVIYQSFLYRTQNINLHLKGLSDLLKTPSSSLHVGVKECKELDLIRKNVETGCYESSLQKKLPYSPVPLYFFEKILPEISGANLKLALAINRNQFGWGGKPKRNKTLSLKQLLSMTGLSKRTLLLSRKSLKEKGILCQTKQNTSFVYELILEQTPTLESDNSTKTFKVEQNSSFKNSKKVSPNLQKLTLQTPEIDPIPSVSKKEEKKKEKQTGEELTVVSFSKKEEEVVKLFSQNNLPKLTPSTLKTLAKHSLDLIKSSISHISKNIEKIHNPIGFLIKSLKENWQFISPKDIEDEHVKWAEAYFSKLEGQSIPIKKIQGVCFTVSLQPNQGMFIISCGPKVVSVPYKFKGFKAAAKALYEGFLNGSSPSSIQNIPGVV